MNELTDIELNGTTLALVPGQYARGRVATRDPGNAPSRTVTRTEINDFSGGLGTAAASGREITAGWDGITVAPAFDGHGVEPFPNVLAFADANILDTPSTTLRAHGVVIANAAFVGIGRRLYKSVLLSNGTWSAFTVATDLGAGFTISGLAYYRDDLLIMLSTGQDIRRYNMSSGAVTIPRTGAKGVVGVGYGGEAVTAPLAANAEDQLQIWGTKWNGNAITHTRRLDAPIVRMTVFDGKVAIATRKSLYFLGGRNYPGEADDPDVAADTSKAPAWTEDPQPVMSHGVYAEGDDFVFLESYRGELYTWFGSRVGKLNESAGEGIWERMGPEGAVCYGACVAGDWLLVALQSRYAGNFELWGYNGEGWWLLGQRTSANSAYVWPCPLAGAGNREALVFRAGVTDYDLFRLRWRDTTLHTYATAGTWTSPLLDGEDPGVDKRWLRGGAVFASPSNRGNSASVDGVIFPLEYSLDGGATWTVAVSQSSTSGATRVFTRDFAFSNPPTGRTIQLRQRWSSVLDWAPVLTNMWVESETVADYTKHEVAQAAYDNAVIESLRQRRRWELAAGTRQLNAADAQTKIEELWNAWESSDPLLYKDADYADDPIVYTVHIVDIEEQAPASGASGAWGERVVKLTLEESVGYTPVVSGVYGAGLLYIDPAGAITLPVIPSVAAAIEARIDTDELAATDDLTSIVVQGTITTGTLLILRSTNSARDPRIVDSGAGASGNLRLVGDVSYTLAAITNGILLEYTTTNVWTEKARW